MNNKVSSRKISWEILKKVFIKKSFSNILLNEVSNQKNIEEKFKNLIFTIVHGTITNKIYLEYLTNKLINQKKTPIEVQIILWMSIYQMHYLDSIPNYAIVNEAVDLAKNVNKKFSSLVNACLKKIINLGDEFYKINQKDEHKRICIEYSFPYKLFVKISSEYSEEIALKIVYDSVEKPNISFRVNTLKANPLDIFEQYKDEYELQKTLISDSFIAKKPIIKSDLYKNGQITIQDQASILVSQTLKPNPNSKVLDMASAPGGKLTHLSAIMQNTGSIDAYEISENKIKLIEQNIKRLGTNNISLHLGDSTKINKEPEFYDYILLDAPCSGFGVLKRKPEIKLNYNLNSIKNIIKLQKELLKKAYSLLKPGGILVYSTCTINLEENNLQIDDFISKHNNMKILSSNQIFGFENNTDGFFICKMQKNF